MLTATTIAISNKCRLNSKSMLLFYFVKLVFLLQTLQLHLSKVTSANYKPITYIFYRSFELEYRYLLVNASLLLFANCSSCGNVAIVGVHYKNFISNTQSSSKSLTVRATHYIVTALVFTSNL